MSTAMKQFTSARFLSSGDDHCIASKYVFFEIGVPDFLRMTAEAYETQGRMDGQRDVVRTATAARIRTRMAKDIQKGAVLPAIVLGTTKRPLELQKHRWTDAELVSVLTKIAPKGISIIDGMQRTTVLREGKDQLKKHTVRVELWFAPRTDKLIYRMLILNTGQIPWTIRRQLEVVYRNLIEEIAENKISGFNVYKVDESSRRTRAGEFQAHDVIEMYLAFSLRKPHVDNESALADQFSRLDLIESVDRSDAMEEFVQALELLVRLDHSFSRITSDGPKKKSNAKIATASKDLRFGRQIFDKSSACAAFMAAYAQFVRGRVGMDRSDQNQVAQAKKAKRSVEAVNKTLRSLDALALEKFLSLDTLNEVLDKRLGGKLSIGESEREVFTSAFRLLLDEGGALQTLEPCWRSQ